MSSCITSCHLWCETLMKAVDFFVGLGSTVFFSNFFVGPSRNKVADLSLYILGNNPPQMVPKV